MAFQMIVPVCAEMPGNDLKVVYQLNGLNFMVF